VSSATARSWWSDSVATISAHADPDAVFKRCCMPGGRFDGSQRDDYRRD
jgi:hypothetical protein